MNDVAGNDGTMRDDREGPIRDRAYAIWQEEGEPEGRDAEHWHRAASEVATPGAIGEGDPVVGGDPTVGVDASGTPTEDSAATSDASDSGETVTPGPIAKLKKKTAKIAKSL